MKILDHMEILVFIFLGTSLLFSVRAVPFDIATDSAQRFCFLYILTNTCCFLVFCFCFFFFIVAILIVVRWL